MQDRHPEERNGMNVELVLFCSMEEEMVIYIHLEQLPSAEAVACTARSVGGGQLKYLANERSHQSRRSHGGSAAMATATPSGGGEMVYPRMSVAQPCGSNQMRK